MPKIDTILLFQSQGLAFLVDVMYNGTGLGYSTANTPICYFWMDANVSYITTMLNISMVDLQTGYCTLSHLHLQILTDGWISWCYEKDCDALT